MSQPLAVSVNSRDSFAVNKHVTVTVNLKGQSGFCRVQVKDHRSSVILMNTLKLSTYNDLVVFFETNTHETAIEEAIDRYCV